jgi:Trypsin
MSRSRHCGGVGVCDNPRDVRPILTLVAGRHRCEAIPPSQPHYPGVGAHNPCGRLDPDELPWRAVGKLQIASLNVRQVCTATLVGPSTVLTAAHCAFNPSRSGIGSQARCIFLSVKTATATPGISSPSNPRPGPASNPADRPRRPPAGAAQLHGSEGPKRRASADRERRQMVYRGD